MLSWIITGHRRERGDCELHPPPPKPPHFLPQHRPQWLPPTSRARGQTPGRQPGFELEAAPPFRTPHPALRPGPGNLARTHGKATVQWPQIKKQDVFKSVSSQKWNTSNLHHTLLPLIQNCSSGWCLWAPSCVSIDHWLHDITCRCCSIGGRCAQCLDIFIVVYVSMLYCIFLLINSSLRLCTPVVQYWLPFTGCFSTDRPGVWPGSLLSCWVRCGVFLGRCRCVLFVRLSLVVFVVGGGWWGGRFVRFGFILEPQCGAVEASSQAAAPGFWRCWCSYHCSGNRFIILSVRCGWENATQVQDEFAHIKTLQFFTQFCFCLHSPRRFFSFFSPPSPQISFTNMCSQFYINTLLLNTSSSFTQDVGTPSLMLASCNVSLRAVIGPTWSIFLSRIKKTWS